MRTVKDVIDEFGGNAVFVHRHATYLMNPEGKNNPEDPYLLAAQNYARKYPDHNNPLDQNGRDVSVQQGRKLVEMGVRIKKILISRQGRGPETGLYLAIGILNASDSMSSLHHSVGADYPTYQFEGLKKVIETVGDSFVAQWLNGKRPGQCTIEPEEYCGTVTQMVKQAMEEGGITFVATHFECAMLTHGLFVEGKDLGDISEEWLPTKSAGVLLVEDRVGKIYGFEYDPDFNIVE